MTVEEIMKSQFVLGQSTKARPELKKRVQDACTRWAENSRKYGVIPTTRFFHKGV